MSEQVLSIIPEIKITMVNKRRYFKEYFPTFINVYIYFFEKHFNAGLINFLKEIFRKF